MIKVKIIDIIAIISNFVTKNINTNNPSNTLKIFRSFILITLTFISVTVHFRKLD